MTKRILVVFLVLAVVAVLAASIAVGKGKPQPPSCDCPETITLPNGSVCTLEACGFDCVYVCPLP